MIELQVATEIDAAPAAVWRALTDLPRFSEWNPFIRAASGVPAVGSRLRVRVRPSLGVPLVFHPTVLAVEKDRELHWRGCFISPWLASGEHWFMLEPAGEGRTRLVQREIFAGLLTPLFARLIEREGRAGFEAMNRALKERVERAAAKA